MCRKSPFTLRGSRRKSGRYIVRARIKNSGRMRYFSVISAPAIPNSRAEALKAAANKEIPHPRASFLSFRAGQTTPRLDHANTRMRPPQKNKLWDEVCRHSWFKSKSKRQREQLINNGSWVKHSYWNSKNYYSEQNCFKFIPSSSFWMYSSKTFFLSFFFICCFSCC